MRVDTSIVLVELFTHVDTDSSIGRAVYFSLPIVIS